MTQTLPQTSPPNTRSSLERDFRTFSHVIHHSDSFLLVAHSRPDADTIGSTVALFYVLSQQKKRVFLTCTDPLPEEFSKLFPDVRFHLPKEITIRDFDVVIACDSVERGYAQHILPQIDQEHQITILLDHHHDIQEEGDITLIDPQFSSTCELLTHFFQTISLPITTPVATALLCGILGDTGNFQHSNTTTRVLETASELLKKGAPLHKLTSRVFSNKKLSTLRLWGRAFEKAKIFSSTGMIVTGLTKRDLQVCAASAQDVAEVANMLATVPGVRFALIITQDKKGVIKGSFRAEPMHDIDVSSIAHKLGGGGHSLASGFEIQGTLIDTQEGWFVR